MCHLRIRVIRPYPQSCTMFIFANSGGQVLQRDMHRGQSTSLVVRGCNVRIWNLTSLTFVSLDRRNPVSISIFAIPGGQGLQRDIHRSQSTSLVIRGSKVGIGI